MGQNEDEIHERLVYCLDSYDKIKAQEANECIDRSLL